MNTECLQAAARTMVWSEANYGTGESWDLIKDNLLNLTNSSAPPYPLRSWTIPLWWSSRMKKALGGKRAAGQRPCATGGYLRRKSFDCILLDAKRAF
ncbi:unnamed protein product [Echinostoma caproni]|uniref:Uncharacterized protein n=1 Tax=Echinostoma caproni TaxID=27848 RepID=A0A183B5A4_9TREM|nr:unnamed protein product [Echinostoma caproni]